MLKKTIGGHFKLSQRLLVFELNQKYKLFLCYFYFS